MVVVGCLYIVMIKFVVLVSSSIEFACVVLCSQEEETQHAGFLFIKPIHLQVTRFEDIAF